MRADLSFTWDGGNTRHIARHGITPRAQGEGRWTIIGHTHSTRFLVVVWTMRAEDVRPITAFEAGKRLRDAYVAARGL